MALRIAVGCVCLAAVLVEARKAFLPFGCVTKKDLDTTRDRFYYSATCRLSYELGVRYCCQQRKLFGFAMGGVYSRSPMKTHHNMFRCLETKPAIEYQKYESCDQKCPGYDYRNFYNNDAGLCGGGCGDCPNFPSYEKECTSDKSIPCGSLFSVYDCKQEEEWINHTSPPDSLKEDSTLEEAKPSSATTTKTPTTTKAQRTTTKAERTTTKTERTTTKTERTSTISGSPKGTSELNDALREYLVQACSLLQSSNE